MISYRRACDIGYLISVRRTVNNIKSGIYSNSKMSQAYGRYIIENPDIDLQWSLHTIQIDVTCYLQGIKVEPMFQIHVKTLQLILN